MWNFLGPAQRIAQANPWLKWTVVVLVGLFAVEFIAQRGIALYVQLETAPQTVKKATGDAELSKAQGDAAAFNPDEVFSDAAGRAKAKAQREAEREELRRAEQAHIDKARAGAGLPPASPAQ